MNQDAGKINIVFAADTEDVERGAERIESVLNQTGDSAEVAGKRIDNAFKQEVMSARELNAVIETQNKVVSDLRDAYERAKQAASDAFGGDEAKYSELLETQEKLKKEYDEETEALKRLNAQRDAMDTSGDAEESLRTRLRQATQEIATLTLKYREMSDEEKSSAQGQELRKKLEDLTAKAGDMRDAMDDANRSIRGMASDTSSFDALAGGLNVITSTAGAAQGALSMLGVNQEDLMDIQTKLQASLAISNALSVIQNNLQKESAVMLGVRRIQERAAAAAIAIRTAVENKGVIATKAATVAQAAFNAVAKANPYVLLAMALVTVVGALAAFSLGSKKAAEAEKKQAEEAQKLKEKQEEMAKAIGNATGNMEAKYRSLQKQWNRLKSDQEKTKWIKDNAGAFKELGLKVKDVGDAQKVLVDMAPQVVAALKAVAEAGAYDELYRKSIIDAEEHRREWEQTVKRGEHYTKLKPANGMKSVEYIGLDIPQEWIDAGVTSADYTTYTNSSPNASSLRRSFFLQKSGIDKVNAYKEQQALETGRKLQAEYDDEIKYYSDKWDEAQDRAMAARAQIPSSLLDDDGNGNGNDKPDPKAALEAQKRAEEAYNKALEDARKAREDASAAELEDEEERTLRQMMLTHTRKLAEIRREQEELLAAKRAAQGDDATLTDDELNIFADRINAENTIYERSLRERSEAAAAKEKADMEDYLITYGTYQERVNAIHDKYTDLKAKAETEGARLSLTAQEEDEINSLNERFGYATKAMADLFADASKKSVNEIQKIITKYETLIKYMEGQKAANTGGENTSAVTTQDLKGLGFTDADIKRIESGEINVKDLTDAIKQLKGELGERSPWLTFQKDIKDAVQKLKEGDLAGGIGEIGSAVKQFTPAVKALGDQLGEAFGFETEDFDSVMTMFEGVGGAAQAAGQFMSGDFVGGAMSAVSAIGSIAGAITDLIDRKHERRIKELQKQIDKIEESYADLEEAVSRTYSYVKQKNIDLEIESKRNQINLIKQQIQEERDKKKTDNGRIEEWEKKIRELERDISDLREAAVDAIFGESVQNAIENFASAYAEAWASGEDKAKSAKDTVKNMMKQMVTESIKSAIQASGAMERIRRKLQEFYADNVLSPWEQDYVMKMAENLQRELDARFGWADGLFSPDKSESQDSTKRGFETMTQDQASELSGRFTGIQMETAAIDRKLDAMLENNTAMRINTASIAEGMSQMVELQGVAVSHLAQIERNTNELPEMNERLEKIEKNTRSL